MTEPDSPAFPRRLLNTLWPVPIGALVGWFGPRYLTPRQGWMLIAAFMFVMMGLSIRMMFLVAKMRFVRRELHELTARMAEAYLPEAKRIDLRISDRSATELITHLAGRLRALGKA